MERLESAPLGGPKVIGQGEAGQALQGLDEPDQALLQRDRPRRERGRSRAWAEGVEGRSEERAAVGLVGDTVGGHERACIVSLQSVPLDARDERVLLLALERTKGARERGAHRALADFATGRIGQARADRDAPLDPVVPMPEQTGDRLGCQPVVVDERADDPSLVERGDRARRCIGGEQESFVLLGQCRPLDHSGHEAIALRAPALPAFEPVENLVGPIGGRSHAQGQLGDLGDTLPAPARAQRGVARPDLVDGQKAHAACCAVWP